MHPTTLLAILTIVTLAAPAATATRAAVNLGEGMASADIELFLTIEGQDASRTRAAIDEFGNGDGQATHDEAEEYADHLKPTLGQAFLDAVKTNWTIDGVAPTLLEMQEFEYYHAAGAATSEAAFEMEVVMEATYPSPKAGVEHQFHFTLGQMGRAQGFPGPVSMSVKAPADQRIAHVSPTDGIQFHEDGTLAKFTDAADAAGAIVFTFAASDAKAAEAKGAPGPAFALVAAASALALVLSRGRRSG